MGCPHLQLGSHISLNGVASSFGTTLRSAPRRGKEIPSVPFVSALTKSGGRSIRLAYRLGDGSNTRLRDFM